MLQKNLETQELPVPRRAISGVLFAVDNGRLAYARRYVSKKEAAQYLGISVGTFVTLMKTGKLVLTKYPLGKRRILYDLLEVEQAMASVRQPAMNNMI